MLSLLIFIGEVLGMLLIQEDVRMTVPLLEVKDLDVSFGAGDTQISAVKGASFQLIRESGGLIGESGSGKWSQRCRSCNYFHTLLLPIPVEAALLLKACNWLQATQRR